MWLSEQTSSAELQTDLVHRGATKVARPALMAVGADYNLLLAMRIREEARAGLGAGIIRAFAVPGGHLPESSSVSPCSPSPPAPCSAWPRSV